MMDERMILKSDVERVWQITEKNQEAILDEETKELVDKKSQTWEMSHSGCVFRNRRRSIWYAEHTVIE